MWARKESSDQSQEPDFENFTLLAKDVDFKGVVNFDGTVRVDGRVEGEIHTTGTLIVGEHAVIKGVVSAGVLMNSGRINGTITAVEKIQILKPGVLVGDIRTPLIAIEEGSHFHGMCDMGVHAWSEPAQVSIAS
ncbi:MAG TPA: polymer-forming cytoskeletal protein [Nitrospira sp.]|jgi:cytoskeletal protein CcmA (bactofilin family)|nr:polymer-forming cytoskeletal protein [Nitrospira sp.]